MLKSARQGTGKTTLNAWMCRIFGGHARIISDKDRLFDRFNCDLETAVFVDADEMLWAGDRGTADKLKSRGDGIVGVHAGIILPLNKLHPSNVLYEAYKGNCKNHPANNVVFGKALTQMFGESSRQKVEGDSDKSRRPRTYRVPDADSWQQALDRRLGIGARK